ncbi:MAG: hypothetical protein QOE70_2677 [Chthoniobacter sp.]|jgi:arylsulfatase A-like enzyme|nr:hypothetical protein [Chthoniobacter sp.]
MKTTLSLFLVTTRAFLLSAAFIAAAPAAEPGKPNIVFVLVDDLGATDLGCYGSKFYQTPHINRLAREGMKFTQAYSACTVCSPTRASLLTGRYPAALHLTDWIPGHARPAAKLRIPDWTMRLTHDLRTLPQALHDAGYVSAAIGKWHLGEDGPERYGFDVALADNGKGQPASYFPPYQNPRLPDGPPDEFLTDRLTSEAEKFIEKNQDRPFFVYLSHFAVHTPLGGKPDVIAKYRAQRDENAPQHNAVYAALIESVDDSVGRLRAKLEELKLSDRTIIIFTSDNGGLLPNTTNLGLRAGKGSAYEGGVRVPAIALVPGLTKAGTEANAPIITMDWTATILDLAGAKPLDGAHGVSLTPLLRGGALESRPLFWHYPHYHPGGATPYSAVREGDWRLIEFFEDDRAELFNLRDDPAEQSDRAASEPGRVSRLRAQLRDWRQQVAAQLPSSNPNYDPAAAAKVPRKPGQ